ncbi:rhamnosyltransferase WsaF family glycosyltransferase [Burkholderia dolosa]|uniref:rhamnosyltransferase WsaF family glycosyltransferase n=2 Tax=Burkholderia dolosa TaxID=152500 RepID=UPI001591B932|nr:hypothetical protein [Burkholderia dolosa]MBR8301508.1 hypothetical protein [Burkholderia dolosa]MBY4755837.1 hypothetical protein [Burkholderia dolosa]
MVQMEQSNRSIDVDIEFYRLYYGDLNDMSDDDARQHFVDHGHREGRHPTLQSYLTTGPAPGQIDIDFYRQFYPDLRELSHVEALKHYREHGHREGRFGSPQELEERGPNRSDFDPKFYREHYAQFEFATDDAAWADYLTNGYREGRHPNANALIDAMGKEQNPLPDDFDPAEYLALNGDLRRHLKYDWEPAFHFMRYGRWEGRPYRRWKDATVYDLDLLTRKTLYIYDMPGVVVDPSRKPTVNVLVPAFDFGSMSAGFFGVFQVALFIKRSGFNVRLVMYDEFHFDEAETRAKLKNYPGLESLLDELEFVYIGDRKEPLRISPHDNCVATVWYSAYMARKLMEARGGGKFLYLIQDYESPFHPSGSLFALAEATYSFDYCALFSSQALQDFFLKKQVGIFAREGTNYTYFNNACSSVLKPKEEFVAARANGRKKRLAFYSRPPVDRNMFELGALALCTAYRSGVFPAGEWEFIGIGLGEAVIKLDDETEMKQMPRMNLREYQEVISTFDIGFCLMASPHPSLLPFDLSGSGSVVVTNSFSVKDQTYFDILTQGVIVRAPDVPDLVEGLRQAVAESEHLDRRYENALAMTFPRTWEDTFNDQHALFMHTVFKDTAP